MEPERSKGPDESELRHEPESRHEPTSLKAEKHYGEWISFDQVMEGVYVGNFQVTHSKEFLSDAGIRSIISLNGPLDQAVRAGAREAGVRSFFDFNFVDGPGNDPRLFEAAIRVALRALQDGPLLVHCHAGRSRSPALVAGMLILSRGMYVDEAINFVSSRRSIRLSDGIPDLLYHIDSSD